MDQMLYSEIIASIDDVAQIAEDKGLIREASDLDIIANTLEKEAGLTDLVKKGWEALKKNISKIPEGLKKKLKGKTLPSVVQELNKELGADPKQGLNESQFENLMKGAFMFGNRSAEEMLDKEAGALSKTLGAALLAIMAGAAGKADAKDLTFEEYKRVQDSLYQEYQQNQQNLQDQYRRNNQALRSVATKGSAGEAQIQTARDSVENAEIAQLAKILKGNGAKLEFIEVSSSNSAGGASKSGLAANYGIPADLKAFFVSEYGGSDKTKKKLVNDLLQAYDQIFLNDVASMEAIIKAGVQDNFRDLNRANLNEFLGF
jgi:hypothetical protein